MSMKKSYVRPSRRDVLKKSVLVSAGVMAGTGTTVSPVEATDDDPPSWAMEQYDARNTGHNSSAQGASGNMQEEWVFRTDRHIIPSPVVKGGTVYVGNAEGRIVSGSGTLFALDAEDGSERWRFSPGHKIADTPAVVGDTVYFGSFNGKFYAFHADDGFEKWRFNLDIGYSRAPTVVDGVVYFGSGGSGRSVYAVDAESGDQIWQYTASGSQSNGAIAVHNDVVYFGASFSVFAVGAADGGERWRASVGEHHPSTTPTLAYGLLFVGTGGGDLLAFDPADGEQKWQVNLGSQFSGANVAAANNLVYANNRDGDVYALDPASGETQWQFDTGSDRMTAPAVGKDLLYVGTYDGSVYALDPDSGEPQGSYNLNERIRTISIAGENTFVGTMEGNAYRLAPAKIEVTLDVKPGSDPNAINLASKGVVPVAVLQTQDFDPTERIDVSTLRFGAPEEIDSGGGAEPAHGGHVEDVDDDGDEDLVLHFPTQGTGFDGDEDRGKLVGKTNDGTPLFGTDTVKIVGGRNGGGNGNGGNGGRGGP